jgi:hypothetical protein
MLKGLSKVLILDKRSGVGDKIMDKETYEEIRSMKVYIGQINIQITNTLAELKDILKRNENIEKTIQKNLPILEKYIREGSVVNEKYLAIREMLNAIDASREDISDVIDVHSKNNSQNFKIIDDELKILNGTVSHVAKNYKQLHDTLYCLTLSFGDHIENPNKKLGVILKDLELFLAGGRA